MENNSDQLPLWEVFIQKSGGPFKHEGSVHASDSKMALQNARDVYTRRGEGRTIWVVPANSIASTTVNDEGEFLIRQIIKFIDTQHFILFRKALKIFKYGTK